MTTKNWFITGIGRGLGLALTEAALANGDRVFGTTRDGTAPITHPNLRVFALELTDSQRITETVRSAHHEAGRLDVIVNNAGYGLVGPIEDLSPADARHCFEIDFFAPFTVIQAALPLLRAQKSGHVINITSIAGRAVGPGSGIYGAAKSALESLTHVLSLEGAEHGIKTTAVAQGAFRTDFLSAHSFKIPAQRESSQTASKMVDALKAMDGKQLGDPKKAAQAIIELVASANPPVHLLLGSDALRRARERNAQTDAEMNAWETMTLSTDFP